MLPVIVVPDAELWWVGWLRTALAARTEPYASGVYVSNTRPSAEDWKKSHPTTPYPVRMVTFRRDGGPRVDLVHSIARLGINVRAATEKDVTDLAGLVEGLVLSVRTTGPVEAVGSSSGPSPVEDSQPRRFFTVEAIIRGEVL
jgi:hypothetical protein